LAQLRDKGFEPTLPEPSYRNIIATGIRTKNRPLAFVATQLALEQHPVTLRGLMYRVVSAGWLPSTDKKHYTRLGRLMTTLREAGVVPFSWIVDNVRATEKPSSWSGLTDCRQAAYRKRHRKPRGSLAVMCSSRSDEWPTDPAFFAELAEEFGGFDLDPCATPENAKCATCFTQAEDGLSQRWFGRVYMNPPYGRPLILWMKKALASVCSGDADLVVCLVPARVDTRWWHECVARHHRGGTGNPDRRRLFAQPFR
jgi:site-specific DNA-methyltransferase (adenine-specific)